jgi:hypothetical protein
MYVTDFLVDEVFRVYVRFRFWLYFALLVFRQRAFNLVPLLQSMSDILIPVQGAGDLLLVRISPTVGRE